jgi:uncharacterized CHY-type Zn-finger protein
VAAYGQAPWGGHYDLAVVPKVYGHLVDDKTRCTHWHGPTDVIAIRFPCCDRYYACFDCHSELELHEARRWGQAELDTTGVLCGECGAELAISAYLESGFVCPSCGTAFNPKCALHHDLYFELKPRG